MHTVMHAHTHTPVTSEARGGPVAVERQGDRSWQHGNTPHPWFPHQGQIWKWEANATDYVAAL